MKTVHAVSVSNDFGKLAVNSGVKCQDNLFWDVIKLLRIISAFINS